MKSFLTLAIATGVAMFSTAASAACPYVPNSASEQFRFEVKQDGGWPVTDAQCEFLLKHNLVLNVVGDALVLQGRAIGFVVARVARNGNMVSSKFTTSTYIDNDPNSTRANQMMMRALADAVKTLDFEASLKELNDLQPAEKKKK